MGADDRLGAGDGGERRRGPAVVAALAVAVVIAGLIAVLATREPAQNRRTDSPLLGRAAPPIEGSALDGRPFDIDQLRGRWVVVNFFATWCVPCRTEHPELVSFSRRHLTTGDAEVVSVVFDDDPDTVAAFFDQEGGDWPVLDGTGTGVILDYAVAQVPESFLVAPNGRVVAKLVGGVTSAGLDRVISEFDPAFAAAPTAGP